MRGRRKRSLALGILCCLLVFMGIGFAAARTTLNITGTSTITNAWDVRLSNVLVTNASDGVTNNEEFTKLVVMAFGIPSAKNKAGFDDVAEENWAKDYINAAYENGIVNGISESKFGFGTNISRQDMALMVLRAAEKMGRTFETGEITSTDASDIADYAKEAVGKMMKAGIINGFSDNTFLPNANATRAQAAKIIYALVNGMEAE